MHLVNDRDPENREDDLDPERAKLHVAEIDFRRFAGPLLHWARSAGACETPLWKALETAVATANLPVVPGAFFGSDEDTDAQRDDRPPP